MPLTEEERQYFSTKIGALSAPSTPADVSGTGAATGTTPGSFSPISGLLLKGLKVGPYTLEPPTNPALSERSYEFGGKSIDAYQKPVDERLDRMSRLQDTLNQMTPQADALVAPELLTVMAGGQGSGLRMNEAEIERIVGGRTNVEAVKAALNKWQTNPTKGLSITLPQREQIRNLVAAVQDKLTQKSEVLNGARQELLDATTPKEHRQVIVRMRKALQEIDAGNPPTATSTVGQPNTPQAQGGAPQFNSEQEAMAANLPKGSVVTIGGRRARIN